VIMRLLILITISIQFIISDYALQAQTVKGHVMDNEHQSLIGATIKLLDKEAGTATDENGMFSLNASPGDHLVVRYLGYQTDTLKVQFDDPMHIMMQAASESLGEVVVESKSTFFDAQQPIHNEVILESELTKAACCNLSESFETNASVDVSYSDAVSGAKVIRMLGLDGRYVQINRENIPLIRGLTARYGLGFVPGTWIQSIDVGKGAGSVVNGFESMTGQINLEFKKPENSEKLYINAYANSFGRTELNVNTSFKLTDKWSGALMTHSDYFASEIDRNDDGFMDLPKSRQINVLNRYKYQGDKLVSQVGIHIMRDEKVGGQNGFGFDSDHQTSQFYGFSNNTTRLELFGKTGLLFPAKPYKGWGFIYSGSYQKINAGFGKDRYEGTEKTFYGNVIFQNIIHNTQHQYKTGVSILFDDFDEIYMDSSFSRQEIIPGAYFEYSYLPDDNFSLVLGTRLDQHNLYGTYFTPRIHLRYQPVDNTTVRLATGRGYRTPNPLIENTSSLISSRRLIIGENIRPEESWNMGGSIVKQIDVGEKQLQLVADYFYTSFVNQMIVDMDASSDAVSIDNLNGRSYAHSFQFEGSISLTKALDMKAAYKLYDVRATINGAIRQVPFVPKNRVFLNLAYATRFDKWKADLTYQWIGRKRLPNTTDKPDAFQIGEFSPDYSLVNAQVSRGFRWGSIYLGSENLFDFRQDDPIIDAENPFGEQFDASLTWGPVAGRLVYAGIRYKIKSR